MFKVPERYREKKGLMGTTDADGNNGVFIIPVSGRGYGNPSLIVIASDGLGWEHVSVSLKKRTPTWGDMCFVKSLFWDSTDTVVQFHPSADQYVNNHPHCLHLWRQANSTIQLPPMALV